MSSRSAEGGEFEGASAPSMSECAASGFGDQPKSCHTRVAGRVPSTLAGECVVIAGETRQGLAGGPRSFEASRLLPSK